MKKEILIVEDCTLTKTWLTEQFYSTDYEVNSVDLGEDCISYIQELKPSLILLDISMPGISGLGLLDYIRSIHDMTELPVTIITSSDDKEILTDVLSAGANDYFIKPIDPVILMAKINLQIQFNSIQFNSIQFNSIQFNKYYTNNIKSSQLKAINEMIGTYNHEINGPLTIAFSYIDLELKESSH